MRYLGQTDWLEPFVREAERRGLVDCRKLRAIRGYRIGINRKAQHDGSLIKHEDGTATLYLLTHNPERKPGTRKRFQSPIRIGGILQTLAHELAHLEHFEHTPEHFILEARINRLFGQMLKRLDLPNYETCPNREWGVYESK